jgi:hypothetical protein
MSIIVQPSKITRTDRAEKPRLVDSAVRDLLDHIAVELAAEYVRLMEVAANAEAPSSLTSQADN